ncbi:hypothetical protein S83_004203 [Arachis hypogaea]
MPGTSADHPTDDRAWEQPQFDIRSDDMMDIDDMFEILGAPSHEVDTLASRYRHRRDDTDIPWMSSSVSTRHGIAPLGHYQTPPPPPHQSALPPPMTVSAPPPPPYQCPPLTFSQPGVRPRPFRLPRVSCPCGCGTGHHLDPTAGRR